MIFWIVYLLLFVLFLITVPMKFTKMIKWESWFSPKTTHIVQLSILIVLALSTGIKMYSVTKECLESPATSSSSSPSTNTTKDATKSANQVTLNTIDATNKGYAQMTKQQLAAKLSVYGKTYTANSDFIEQLYNEIHEYEKPVQKKLSTKELAILGNAGKTEPGALPIYYEPGTYMYSGTGYEPSYGKLMMDQNEVLQPQPIHDAPYLSGGFCTYYKDSPIEKENSCNALNPGICASTDCCILLNGKKCVAGNEYGASQKANYSDFLLGNVDFYYYQGKCYGNCPY